MKRFVMTATALIAAAGLCAQEPGFEARLAVPDSLFGSQVFVKGYDPAAVSRAEVADAKVQGYRVRIFFDNSQQSRALADRTMTEFCETFEEIPVYKDYQNPYFRVSVGNCLSIEEAIMLWGKVKDRFPKAFIIREEIPLVELLR